ncbi:MAG: NADH-quinone oxidoreductase subunit D [Kineosporiaceae bacterium]|jgi:NADH-quinone oxidoreductase subunit D
MTDRTIDDPTTDATTDDPTGPTAGPTAGPTDGSDPYGVFETDAAEGTVFTAGGGDWTDIAEEAASLGEERIVVNMGPQHPSTHGVLRLILELDGETVTEARCGIGYLHTGIEKNMEFRTWTQGVTFCTRMDYLSPLYQETAYCLGVEKLLGITDEVPERASTVRVMLMELNRVSSHVVALATGGLEIGALTVMTVGFRMRERVLKLFELVTGLRMNHAFIRPGGLSQDIPPGAIDTIRDAIPDIRRDISDIEKLSNENPLVKARLVDVGYLDLAGCMALGITGPVLRSTGLPHDLRRSQPYCGYETYDFDVVTWDSSDAYGRLRIRIEEMKQSLDIVEQTLDRLQESGPGPVMIGDRKIAWPAQLAIGGDGMGNSLDHIREIMGTSMEALIHHFKLVTEGFRVPVGQVYSAVESPRGELACHLVSDGGTRPYRAHFRDPSFVNLQAVAAMCEGGQVADVIAAVASLDPVMGGVDR